MMQKSWKIIETLAYGYSSESTQRELSNEYQHDRVSMFFKDFCIPVLWTKVASALKGLWQSLLYSSDHMRLQNIHLLHPPQNSIAVPWPTVRTLPALHYYSTFHTLPALYPRTHRAVCTNLTLTLLPLIWDLPFESVLHQESTRDGSCSCSDPERGTLHFYPLWPWGNSRWSTILKDKSCESGVNWEWGWCIPPLVFHCFTIFAL